MNLDASIIFGYGTSEGVRKAWDTRGRGRASSTGDVWPPASVQDANVRRYYHGTVLPSAKKILMEGLKQDPTQEFKIGMTDEGYGPTDRVKSDEVRGSEDGYVYLTPSKSLAESYAKYRDQFAKAQVGDVVPMHRVVAGDPFNSGIASFWKPPTASTMQAGRPAVIELTLPESEYKNLEPDDAGDPHAWRKDGIIPKDYITGVEVLSGNRWQKVTPDQLESMAAARKTGRKVYLVYHGNLAALKMHLQAGQ